MTFFACNSKIFKTPSRFVQFGASKVIAHIVHKYIHIKCSNVDCVNSHNLFAVFIWSSDNSIDFRVLYELFDKCMACEKHFTTLVKYIA